MSIISRSQYDLSQRHHSLQSSDVTLQSYNGVPEIPCLGCIKPPDALDSIKLPLFKFYVTAKGESVMGVRFHFVALGGSDETRWYGLCQPVQSETVTALLSMVTLAEYPTLTSGFGRLKLFRSPTTHTIVGSTSSK